MDAAHFDRDTFRGRRAALLGGMGNSLYDDGRPSVECGRAVDRPDRILAART